MWIQAKNIVFVWTTQSLIILQSIMTGLNILLMIQLQRTSKSEPVSR